MKFSYLNFTKFRTYQIGIVLQIKKKVHNGEGRELSPDRDAWGRILGDASRSRISLNTLSSSSSNRIVCEI